MYIKTWQRKHPQHLESELHTKPYVFMKVWVQQPLQNQCFLFCIKTWIHVHIFTVVINVVVVNVISMALRVEWMVHIQLDLNGDATHHLRVGLMWHHMHNHS